MKNFAKYAVFTIAAALVCSSAFARLPKGCTVWGQVLCDGQAMPGVCISDGLTVVKTDKKGYYYLKSDKKEGSVFISIPSCTEVDTEWGMPAFWQPLTSPASDAERHDFALRKVDNNTFTLIAVSDIHLGNIFDDQKQFRENFIPRFNEEVAKARGPVYCLNCGDSSYDRYWYEYLYSIKDFPGTLKDCKISVPMFCVMGNHDNDGATPQEGDVDFNAAAAYRQAIGPTHYSINIGGIHFIMLDNIVYKNSEGRVDSYDGINGKRDYEQYIRADQMQWLKNDLATVSDRTAPLVVAYHCPMFQYKSGMNGKPIQSRLKKDGADPDSLLREFSALFRGFSDVHCISGHTHKNLFCSGCEDTTGRFPDLANMTEHNITGVCGCWWQVRSHGGLSLAPDGAPSGFEVFNVCDRDIKWYFVSNDDGAQKQFRVFDLNSVREYWRTDGEVRAMVRHLPGRDLYSDIEDNLIMVNVWAYETGWKVEVSEEGRPLKVKMKKAENPQLTVSYRLPKMAWDDLTLKKRWPEKQNKAEKSAHYFFAKTSSPTSTVTVTVTDNFGNVYTETVARPKAFSKTMR